ncbi:phage tail protein [Dyadobacter subterraneus]|uniref:Phage tail protein n=1 Tax=Dyadobacter subterraneus TaxID=2773304 RepID=A0ABR9W8J1_9BACT|nr:tail fiber protein [Dyadobacter subterraneus]MBE9461797.1 phage tail protein [Dyadobacter subterraneus]
MAQPYIGEIRMFAGNFPPAGWEFCNGQILPISEYEFLFNLIGTTYGGDGQETFALPDMQGRIPVHQGNGRVLSENGGAEEITLNVNQIPSHTHGLVASSSIANSSSPVNNSLAVSSLVSAFVSQDNLANMNTGIVTNTGGSQPHTNMQPSLCVNFIISTSGIFPSQY